MSALRKCRHARMNHKSKTIDFFHPNTRRKEKKCWEKRLSTFWAKVLFPEAFKDLAQQNEEEDEDEERGREKRRGVTKKRISHLITH